MLSQRLALAQARAQWAAVGGPLALTLQPTATARLWPTLRPQVAAHPHAAVSVVAAASARTLVDPQSATSWHAVGLALVAEACRLESSRAPSSPRRALVSALARCLPSRRTTRMRSAGGSAVRTRAHNVGGGLWEEASSTHCPAARQDSTFRGESSLVSDSTVT